MGLFYSRRNDQTDHCAAALQAALEEEPAAIADKAGEAKRRAAKVRQDSSKEPVEFHARRVAVGTLIAAALVVGAVVLAQAVDNQAISEALRKVQTDGYVPPDLSGLKTVAEWLRTLGAAWSAALVTVLLTEKAEESK